MNQIKFFIFIIFICSFFSCNKAEEQDQKLKLWYTAPASDWMKEALPIGNGYIGAMVFGGIKQEQIQLSEGSLWEGGPGSHPDYNFGNLPDAWKALDPIRKLLSENKADEANNIANKELTGTIHTSPGLPDFGDFGANQTAGDMFIDISGDEKISDYYRDLNLSEATVNIQYTQGTTKHKRTYFASYPKRMLVLELENDKPEGTEYTITYASPHLKVNEVFDNKTYLYEGQVTSNKLGFQTAIKVINTDGTVTFSNGKIHIKGAKKLDLAIAIATEYVNHYPDYRAAEWKKIIPSILKQTENTTFEKLMAEHITDYQALFNRVSLDLGKPANDSLPTNERLIAYQKGTPDNNLEALFFQYARYLLISCSRPGTMPANLQGKWNKDTNPPWSCDYHTNINMQMIYWPALSTNLAECNIPILEWTEHLVEPGKVSAKDFFNTRGWIVNTMNNAFGYTAPGWGLPWGFFPAGAAWLCQHSWEHYNFTQDTTYLKQHAYPVMKEAALFWMDYLTKDENGEFVSSPSYSPEHGGISAGASMDHQIAWDLLNNCVKAASILNIDDDFTHEAINVRDHICKPRIGRWGQLQEWKEDVDDPKDTHRHISHLFALHPGNQISLEKTPELAHAARISLDARGDLGTGWSLAWKINFWARLKDGNRAHKLLNQMINITDVTEMRMEQAGGIYPNMLSTHPPFQLDGNMGGAAGIAEMLVQSQNDNIEILPALPAGWKNGEVKGLCARGGFEVNITWKDGKMTETTIYSQKNRSIVVKYGDIEKNITCTQGKYINLDSELN